MKGLVYMKLDALRSIKCKIRGQIIRGCYLQTFELA